MLASTAPSICLPGASAITPNPHAFLDSYPFKRLSFWRCRYIPVLKVDGEQLGERSYVVNREKEQAATGNMDLLR